jgi:galactonate dehydratase
MKLVAVEAIPVKLLRDLQAATGTAGSPTRLTPGDCDYRWSETVAALYSVHFETALVKLTTNDGRIGWGEAQAPLAPEVACTIIDRLLKPVLMGAEFDGTVEAIEQLWDRMYATMRVRGQTGGFMLDAIAGVDLALWNLVDRPAPARRAVRAYVSGLRPEDGRHYWDLGFRHFKLYYDGTPQTLWNNFDRLRKEVGDEAGIAVDALWRLTPQDAVAFGRQLDQRNALWLECPLMPEDAEAHAALAAAMRTPIALGESYRTRYEIAPFLAAARVVQPDLGRTGITEARRIACLALRVVPHVSIALGPQIYAAIYFAATTPNCDLVEYNPKVLEVANRFLEHPIEVRDGCYVVPEGELKLRDPLRPTRSQSGQ